jgi:hypothetical protein
MFSNQTTNRKYIETIAESQGSCEAGPNLYGAYIYLLNLVERIIYLQGVLIMGSKDKGKKEVKKQKKDGKKIIAPSMFEPVPEVEVIRKKKKEEFPE